MAQAEAHTTLRLRVRFSSPEIVALLHGGDVRPRRSILVRSRLPTAVDQLRSYRVDRERVLCGTGRGSSGPLSVVEFTPVLYRNTLSPSADTRAE
jgi:hypothetical protein